MRIKNGMPTPIPPLLRASAPVCWNDPLKVGAGNELENLTVDPRHQLNFRYYQSGSPFEYELVRFLYKKRELEIAK